MRRVPGGRPSLPRCASWGLELGYARVSTTKQSLERQLDALSNAGIPDEQIYVDKKSGATVERPGLAALRQLDRAPEPTPPADESTPPHNARHDSAHRGAKRAFCCWWP
ncbi:recombinase family protein [Streptomyces milbemycinicus]|uniref:Recombinase family protein n=1 Tax=Streptomyces milbemycinicus TaxID=476552 RepID=A0ABW8M4A1_9ACTN